MIKNKNERNINYLNKYLEENDKLITTFSVFSAIAFVLINENNDSYKEISFLLLAISTILWVEMVKAIIPYFKKSFTLDLIILLLGYILIKLIEILIVTYSKIIPLYLCGIAGIMAFERNKTKLHRWLIYQFIKKFKFKSKTFRIKIASVTYVLIIFGLLMLISRMLFKI